ncbi:MAG: PD-(D/E)XK nuclease family protein [Planctomycetes bacterium]|nr:PD-(D/E)XK nuclease family protein [Planctomycetota bacterium]
MTGDFIATLAATLVAAPLREKILIVPSHRVGRQWLDQAAVACGGVVNVRTTSIARLMLDLAEPELRRRSLRVGSRQEKVRLVAKAMQEVAAAMAGDGYFTRLPVTLDLAERFLTTLEELESAGVAAGPALLTGVTVPAKATELAGLLRRYAAARRAAGMAGPVDIQRAALAALAGMETATPLLVVPSSLLDEAPPLAWNFLSRWPNRDRVVLEDDGEEMSEPPACYVADSVADEVREVFRRLQQAGVPLDQAEVVCTDSAGYIPVLCAVGLEIFGGRPEELPLTFHNGIPAGFSRPARLVEAWLGWLETDCSGEGLARLVASGLLGDGWTRIAPTVSATRLAARLRFLPLDGGIEGYRARLGDAAESDLRRAETWLVEWLAAVVPVAPDSGVDCRTPDRFLAAATALLTATGDGDGKLDGYVRRALLDAIEQWQPFADWPGFDPLAWLRGTTRRLQVMGLGPMPGHLHVSDLATGGHAGRQHLFILGLDDSRYPGSARQDPVLLDRERATISNGLLRSGRRRDRRERALRRLLARTGGYGTCSHARLDTDGRDLFPSGMFTTLAGTADSPRAALRPDAADACLTPRDDWLHLLLASRGNGLTAACLEPWFPHLAAGRRALTARATPAFTAYDGHVPEAGQDWQRDERTLSPTDLELMASCPQDFFFRRVLAIAPPERYRPQPGQWLAGNVRGSLLHDLFQEFLTVLAERDQRVDSHTLRDHRQTLFRLLEQALRRERRRTPPHDDLACRREEAEMREACEIFLLSEVYRQAVGRPVCFEAALGGAKEEAPPWNRMQPVVLRPDAGVPLRLRGRVDRIDRLADHGGLVIIDYKTGRSKRYSTADPFRQGRHLQPLLYTHMLETALAEAGRPEPVQAFLYFFPMPRDDGRPVRYSRDQLGREGLAIVATLADMLHRGCFPFTTDGDDVAHSDYAPLYPQPLELARAAAKKAAAAPELAGWARLRGLVASGEEGS